MLTLTITISGVLLFAQGVTTSSMSGIVKDHSGETLIGANIVAVHQPSGTSYGTATDLEGNYRIPGMRVGGPYKITVSYTGFGEITLDNVVLRLGENLRKDFDLEESAILLDAIQVTARSGVTGQNVGTSTQISEEQISIMPTLNRDINDYVKMTPQATSYSDGMSFAGINNRFNAIYIDGAVNNDVFGLASSGTNGGSTGISPFSIDIIDQFQVVLSPYDVTLGGFAGGGINAVTKSGTNQFTGTAYYFFQNQNLAGKTNGTLAERLNLEDSERTKLDEFSKSTYGASLGGPIVKDKVFFFTNVEIQKDAIPTPFEVATYTGKDNRASVSDLENLRSTLIDKYNYDPGSFGDVEDELNGVKFFGKLDFNLNERHRLTVRHQYTKAEEIDRDAGRSNEINFSNNGVFFPSITNSSALELNSRFGTHSSNNLILGFTHVNDDRDGIGSDFPFVYIEDGNGEIKFGTEEFSTANSLQQSIFTITDNFKLYKGNHTFTFGTHNEFYDIYNLFIRQNFGTYHFESLEDFLTNQPAVEYDRSYSLVDEVIGDGSAAAAEFNAMQLGFYAQDEWRITNRFNLTYGLRLDIPIITSDPKEDTYFNNTALSKIQAKYEIAKDVKAGRAPDGQLMLSPRVGFEYDFTGDRSAVLRGGIGVFTSRIPFVWPGAMFNNNGLSIGGVNERSLDNILFRSDINNQYTHPSFSIPSGQMDLYVKDFKYPQVLRTNLAFDKTFGAGFNFTAEGLFTKTLNNMLLTNVNSDPAVKFNWTGGPDNRPVYNRSSIDPTYSAVYVASNTSEGYTYNLTTTIAKDFSSGFSAFLAYSFGDAYAVNEGTSSQNSSSWRGQVSTHGRNNPVLGRSDFAAGHRLLGSFSYRKEWSRDGANATTLSLYYNGQSHSPVTYVIGSRSARNINNETGSTSRNRSLIWVPASSSEINLIDYTLNNGQVVSAAEQWSNLDAFIENDRNLKNSRGGYAEKNGSWEPFVNFFDLSLRQDFGASLGGSINRFQVSFDIFNMANLINNKWGVSYSVPGDFNNYFLLDFEGYDDDDTTPQFTFREDKVGKEAFDISGGSSRWRMRIGFRYMFN